MTPCEHIRQVAIGVAFLVALELAALLRAIERCIYRGG